MAPDRPLGACFPDRHGGPATFPIPRAPPSPQTGQDRRAGQGAPPSGGAGAAFDVAFDLGGRPCEAGRGAGRGQTPPVFGGGWPRWFLSRRPQLPASTVPAAFNRQRQTSAVGRRKLFVADRRAAFSLRALERPPSLSRPNVQPSAASHPNATGRRPFLAAARRASASRSPQRQPSRQTSNRQRSTSAWGRRASFVAAPRAAVSRSANRSDGPAVPVQPSNRQRQPSEAGRLLARRAAFFLPARRAGASSFRARRRPLPFAATIQRRGFLSLCGTSFFPPARGGLRFFQATATIQPARRQRRDDHAGRGRDSPRRGARAEGPSLPPLPLSSLLSLNRESAAVSLSLRVAGYNGHRQVTDDATDEAGPPLPTFGHPLPQGGEGLKARRSRRADALLPRHLHAVPIVM